MSTFGSRNVQRRRPARPGFTLVELLVVVAIVALLVSILLPSLRSARETARAAVCLSNMKQVGTSMFMYGEVNRGHVPYVAPDPDNQEDSVNWLSLLQLYIKTENIVRCPSDRSTEWEADPFEPQIGVRTTSFVTNNRMTPEAEPPIDRWSQVKHPARKIFMAELKDDIIGDHFHPLSWIVFLSVPEDEIAMKRHKQVSHYWFVDGHVEGLPFNFTWNIDGSIDLYDPTRIH